MSSAAEAETAGAGAAAAGAGAAAVCAMAPMVKPTIRIKRLRHRIDFISSAP